MNDPRSEVSVLTALRADAMLPALQRELARGRRHRRARSRATGACAIVLLLGGAIVAATLTTSRSTTPSSATQVVDSPTNPGDVPMVRLETGRSTTPSLIEIVHDSPRQTVIAMYTNPSFDLASISVTDQELLDMLKEIGRPTGLVRANGRVWLTDPVTDEEVANRRGG